MAVTFAEFKERYEQERKAQVWPATLRCTELHKTMPRGRDLAYSPPASRSRNVACGSVI